MNMNFFINRTMGIGNSGVEHAQFYRAKRFDQVGLPYKFIFVQISNDLHQAMDAWNLKNDQVINMYEYFVLGESYLHGGVQKFFTPTQKITVDGDDTNRLVNTITKSGLQIVETVVKYPSRKKKDFLLVSVDTVEIYDYNTGKKKVRFDFCDNPRGDNRYIKNIHLLNQEGQHMFFWNEVQLQRYFFKKVDEAYNGNNNWFLDRGEESEVALFYPKFAGSKLIEVIHADHLANRDDVRYPLWNNYYEYALTHVSQIDKIVSGTSQQTNDLLKDFADCPNKFATIPVGGVKDFSQIPDNEDTERTYKKNLKLITASRLAGEKHVDIVVRAVSQVRSEGFDISLDIYGAGEKENDIKNTITTVEAENYIKMKGLSHHLDEIYPQYDAFITGSWSEGFGLTTVEALNAGLPVISYAARFGALEMIQDGFNGFLQPLKVGDENLVFNVDSLAEGIKRLINTNYGQMKKATHESMVPFQDHIIADRWKDLLYELRSN